MRVLYDASPAKLDLKFSPPQLTPSNKGTIIIGMCEGLLHLHSKDIVHQDLKPENIMVRAYCMKGACQKGALNHCLKLMRNDHLIVHYPTFKVM